MKKKILLFIAVFFAALTVFAEEDSFINALKNCSNYTSSDTINVDGINAKSNKQISGWQEDKCVYKETLNLSGNNICITCKFNKSQIQEISSVADAYYTTLKYTKERPDLTSVETVQNNPLAQVMNKYLTDPSVCNMSGL